MAKYDSTKFYWLQLKEDFFDEDAIDWLEDQPNGKEYSLFYLKLCLKSLRTNGVLIRQVGNMLVPYDHTKLGELTKTPPDTVMVAMNLLLQIGLVKKLDNGELYLTQVEHMIGSQSKSAFKKQQQRLAQKNALLIEGGGQMSPNCPPEIEKEEEKELELDLDLEKKKKDPQSKTYFENQQTNALFMEFLAIRKKLKAVNSDRAIKMLLNSLNNYDEQTKQKMLENSIVNSWKGVYPLKDAPQQQQKPAPTVQQVKMPDVKIDIKDMEKAEAELMAQYDNGLMEAIRHAGVK